MDQQLDVQEILDHIEEWADAHQTDQRIALAIATISKDRDDMQEIWEEPTPEQIKEIAEHATEGGKFDAEAMQWGDDTLQAVVDMVAPY